VTYRFKF